MDYMKVINRALAKAFGSSRSRELSDEELRAEWIDGYLVVKYPEGSPHPLSILPPVDFGTLADEEVTKVWVRPRPEVMAAYRRIAARDREILADLSPQPALPPVAPELVAYVASLGER